jgi:hypothetical protein
VSRALDAVIEGDYDKTALPDPLVLTYYFTVRDDRIVRLILVRGPRVDGRVRDWLNEFRRGDLGA